MVSNYISASLSLEAVSPKSGGWQGRTPSAGSRGVNIFSLFLLLGADWTVVLLLLSPVSMWPFSLLCISPLCVSCKDPCHWIKGLPGWSRIKYLVPQTIFSDRVIPTGSNGLTWIYLLGDVMGVNFMCQFLWSMVPRYVLKHYSGIVLHAP